MRTSLNRASVCFFTIILFFSVFAKADIVDNKDFFETDSYYSTVLAAFVSSSHPEKHETLRLQPHSVSIPQNILPPTSKPLRLGKRIQRDTKAPLLFLITGLGGSYDSGVAQHFADSAFKVGYSLVIIPSPMNWRFAINASEEKLPGHPQRDAEDLALVINLSLKELAKNGIRPKSLSLAGYSLGALNAVHLDQNFDFDFKHIVLMNPPVDLVYGLSVIDGSYDFMTGPNSPFSSVDRNAILGSMQTYIGNFTSMPMATRFDNFKENFSISNLQAEWMVAWQFREDLADMIYASQAVKDLGVLETKLTSGMTTKRYNEVRRYGFERYLRAFLLPFVATAEEKAKGLDELFKEFSLPAFTDELASDERYSVIHTANDFLLRKKDVAWLDQTFKSRATIFKNGGHLGNVWTQEYVKALQGGLK